jgi:hypothetical protein
VVGKEGVITDTIPAIKADNRLEVEVKKALITLLQALYGEHEETQIALKKQRTRNRPIQPRRDGRIGPR